MTVAFRAILGAAGRDVGGGGTPTYEEVGIIAPTSWSGVGTDDQFGWAFYPNSDLEVGALRFYDDPAATETVRLWLQGNQQLIASAEVTSGAASYGETSITPVVLHKGHVYVVTSRRADGASRGLKYNPTHTKNSLVTFVGDRLNVGDGFPSTNTGTGLVAADIRFREAGQTPPGGQTTVSRSGSGTPSAFATGLWARFTPGEDTWLKGISDTSQPAGSTFTFKVFEVSFTSVPLVTKAGIAHDGSKHEVVLDEAVYLIAGVEYFIGWGGATTNAINSVQTWAGYTAGTVLAYGTSSPSGAASGWYAPFDLIEAA